MTSECWQQVKALLDQALDRAPDERAAFLEEACAGDADLRDEVLSLLETYDDEEPFFNEGAFGKPSLHAEDYWAINIRMWPSASTLSPDC